MCSVLSMPSKVPRSTSPLKRGASARVDSKQEEGSSLRLAVAATGGTAAVAASLALVLVLVSTCLEISLKAFR